MREELEGKAYVENYVHHLTHELKSPLAAIRGAAELLEEDLPPDDRERFLRNIRGQCARLQDIADKMLDLATVEHRQQLHNPEAISLATLVEQAIDAVQPKLVARSLDVTRALDADAQVRGERFLLSRALSNLLDNAIDFAPAHSTLQVTVARHGHTVRVELRDHGPGIPGYAAGRLFERFYSLPRPDGGAKSSGLGLAFVAQVASLHGGEVAVVNHPDGGALARADPAGARLTHLARVEFTQTSHNAAPASPAPHLRSSH